MYLFVHVQKVIQEIHFQIAFSNQHHCLLLKKQILAILHHVVQTLNAIMESVLACLNFKEILMEVVGRNVSLTQSVLEIRLVFGINVLIHAQVLVGKMLSVKY